MKKSVMFLFFLYYSSMFLYSQMPTPVFDVLDYGAIADGKTKNTKFIQAAIDACAGTGGSVYIHDGIYLTGMLTLKSNMTFYVEKSAKLLGSTDISDYPTQNIPTDNWNKRENGRGLIYSLGVQNLKITGGGTINGNGRYASWTGGSIDELERPIPLWIVQSRRVEISNLNVVDGAMWTIVPFETDSVIIRNVRINSNIVANRDGIDIVDCHHVLIEDCDFYTDDDVICPKSGIGRGVSDVVVRNCRIRKSGRANGIKFGTLSYGSFKNMLFEDIAIEDVNLAGIALEAVDGADIENLVFRRIKMKNVGTPFFILLGDRGRIPDGGVHKIGSISNIIFEDITATNLKQNFGCPISGFVKNGEVHKLKNIQFNNVNIDFAGGLQTIPASPPEYVGQYPEVNMWGNLPAYGFYVRHAENIVFNNCNVMVSPQDTRQWNVCSDTSSVIINNLNIKTVNLDGNNKP